MLEDGVITFPVNGILLWFSVTTGYYKGNSSGKLVITLPGAKVSDYKLEVKTGLSEEGVLPVQFTIGADVAKAKYKIYEGTVSSTDYESKINDVARDENAAAVTKTTTVGLELAKTGVYTIVTVAMDAQGNVVGNSFDKISYVAKGEEVPVVISAGIGSADKYVPKGFSTDNTLEVWCYGTDITEAYIAVVSLADFTSDPQAAIAKALENPVSEEVLEAINGEGYAAPVTGLIPGTDLLPMDMNLRLSLQMQLQGPVVSLFLSTRIGLSMILAKNSPLHFQRDCSVHTTCMQLTVSRRHQYSGQR